MYDAIGNLGAGGAAEPWAVSAANAIVYVPTPWLRLSSAQPEAAAEV